jgi:hypothetical protein
MAAPRVPAAQLAPVRQAQARLVLVKRALVKLVLAAPRSHRIRSK